MVLLRRHAGQTLLHKSGKTATILPTTLDSRLSPAPVALASQLADDDLFRLSVDKDGDGKSLISSITQVDEKRLKEDGVPRQLPQGGAQGFDRHRGEKGPRNHHLQGAQDARRLEGRPLAGGRHRDPRSDDVDREHQEERFGRGRGRGRPHLHRPRIQRVQHLCVGRRPRRAGIPRGRQRQGVLRAPLHQGGHRYLHRLRRPGGRGPLVLQLHRNPEIPSTSRAWRRWASRGTRTATTIPTHATSTSTRWTNTATWRT